MKGQDAPYKRRKPKLSAVCMWSFWKPFLKCWLKLDVIDHVRGTIWTNRRRTRSGNMHFFNFKNTVFPIKENWFYVHLSMRFYLFVGFCFCFLFFYFAKRVKRKRNVIQTIYIACFTISDNYLNYYNCLKTPRFWIIIMIGKTLYMYNKQKNEVTTIFFYKMAIYYIKWLYIW